MSCPRNQTWPLGHFVARVAHDRVRQGAFARSVRPHQRVDLALADGQVDPLEDLLVGHVDMQVFDHQCLGVMLPVGMFHHITHWNLLHSFHKSC